MDTQDTRRSAEHFLALIKASHRGKFKVYIGMSAGVGKTYRMLQEAHQLLDAGVDVQIGYIETHGRPETEALTEGLPFIPRRKLFYKGKELEEMDMQAIINLHPDIVVVDELAHTNIEGSANPKRWQDVMQILDAGISVISAVNIQHIEGVNEQVQEITGIEVHERVPDSVLATADEVVNIDLTADELIERLKAGKIYKPDKVPTALSNFFRQENILQLRELALKEVALRVEKKVENEVTEKPALLHDKLLAVIDSSEKRARRLIRKNRASGHASQQFVHRTLRPERPRDRRPYPAGQPALPDQQPQSGHRTRRSDPAGALQPSGRDDRGDLPRTKNQYRLRRPTRIFTIFAVEKRRRDAPPHRQTVAHEHRPVYIVITMKIQRRLTLGIGILFAMIVLLGIQSVSYVRQLSRATGTILADNYNSLQYAADMLRSLNDIGEDSVSRHALRQSLALQQQKHHRDQRTGDDIGARPPYRGAERPRHRGRTANGAPGPAAHYGTQHGGHPRQKFCRRGTRRLRDVVADRRGGALRRQCRRHSGMVSAAGAASHRRTEKGHPRNRQPQLPATARLHGQP